ncbi:HD-GYP domain-containing protein [Halobacillus sp. H74]|uniref:HD-GYP domain-containing protein n=1 Tax=Halobacillus sp. H74 TaxID=3457436 RepID=UPI003FCDBCB6
MRVSPAQLVPGCLVTKDVMGRTNRPIVPKNTTIQAIHIEVLKKFQIESVEVSNKQTDGTSFNPMGQMESKETTASTETHTQELSPSFHDQYLEAVQSYKKWFTDWSGGSPIDMNAIRKVMIPLLEKVIESKRDVFTLHHYTSSDDYIYHHSVAIGLLSGYLASKMGYNYGEWMQVGLAGVLCDSGMAKLDGKITWKEGALTEAEFEQVKNHPTYSYRNVEKVPTLSAQAKIAILQHHERLNGTGYPLGLGQSKIHDFSQIIAVSDMYHAMTSERLYRRKQSPYKVLEEILQEQFGRYDHKIIRVFVKEMTNYSTGTNIRLSDSRLAEIIFVESNHPTRPMIRIAEDGQILHLKEHLYLHIEEVYD